MRPISFYVFDDDRDELGAIQTSIEAIFRDSKVKVLVVPHLLDSRSKSIESLLLKERPEIVVVDNHIDNSVAGQMFGQGLISEVKSKFPDVVFVLMTKHL